MQLTIRKISIAITGKNNFRVELHNVDGFDAALLPAEDNLAIDDFSRRRFYQLHDRMSSHALATSALADDAQRLLVFQAKNSHL